MSETNTKPNKNLDYPGKPLKIGSSGNEVSIMQKHLNGISVVYKGITHLNADGKYGNSTRDAVIRFQKQFSLKPDGIIGKNTWNAIIAVYLSVAAYRPLDVTTKYPGIISLGSKGDHVRFVQSYLNSIRKHYNSNWPEVSVDGIFGNKTALSVFGFQTANNLSADGKVGPTTWKKLIEEFNKITKL